MKLILTKKQEEQKKKIINNVQTDLLYKLVIDYLDLKAKDKNQSENKYIIEQFDSLKKILDIVDEVNSDKLEMAEALNKINDIGLPFDLDEMNDFITQKPYYKPIFDTYLLFLRLGINEETKDLCFLELYNFYEKQNKKDIKSKQKTTDNVNNLTQKIIKKTNNNLSLKDLKNKSSSFNYEYFM